MEPDGFRPVAFGSLYLLTYLLTYLFTCLPVRPEIVASSSPAAMAAVTEAATAQQQKPETMDVGDDGASGGGGAPRPVFQFGAWSGDKPRELAPATRASCADFEFRPGWSAMTKKGGRA